MQKVSYMGNGETTEFAFNFPYFENTDIIVTKNGAPATEYNIIGTSAGLDADIPYTGGKVVFDTAPTALDSITIARSLPLTRIVDYQPLEKIAPTTLNQDMNYMMEVLKDLQDELNTFQTQYSEITDKESTTTLLARISAIHDEIVAVKQAITDFNEEIAKGYIMTKNDFCSYITNCFTKIPQTINIELNNGTLSLKKNSKVYVPNGVGIFDEQIITNDINITETNNGQYMLFVKASQVSVDFISISNTVSGSTAPGTIYTVWYDTTNNTIKLFLDNPTTPARTESLPVAIFTVSNGSISSIDYVFNGFGYIGSTVFALPGITALIPNGKDPDGRLNNTIVTTDTVKTLTNPSNISSNLLYVIKPDGTIENSLTNYWLYNASKNLWMHNNDIFYCCVLAKSNTTSGAISNWSMRQVCNLQDYGDIS